ncbi:response regulator [Streptomyces sp. M19]
METSSRAALLDLRRLLDFLHDSPAEDARQPGLGDLEELVHTVAAAGLRTNVAVEGVRRELEGSLDIAVYRVVQEMLTNALRHGDGRVDVTLRYGASSLTVTAVNPVPAARRPPQDSPHRGWRASAAAPACSTAPPPTGRSTTGPTGRQPPPFPGRHMSLRILLADDHAMFRSGLRAVLGTQSDLCCVAEVADGQAAVEETARLAPDVAILDIRMPRLDGLRAAELILGGPRNTTKVIVLTTYDDDGYVYRALHMGPAASSSRARLRRRPSRPFTSPPAVTP